MVRSFKTFRKPKWAAIGASYCVSLAVVCWTGCGSSDRVAPVAGIIRYKGSPVSGAAVTFKPTEGGRLSWGITNKNGEFSLTTFVDGDGALVGPHAVSITGKETPKVTENQQQVDEAMASVFATASADQSTKWTIPRRFSNPTTSGLSYDVIARTNNRAEFDLKD